ncbi:MAG: hypothetical protein RLW61_04825 [Gammaproteobacteria bacterium]
MNVLNDAQQAALAELDALGASLSLRYEGLIDGAPGSALSAALEDIVVRRRPLLEELARCERARGQLPHAPEEELGALQMVVDKTIDQLAGTVSLAARLASAEEDWLARIRGATALDWRADEMRLLERLEADAREAVACLQGLAS